MKVVVIDYYDILWDEKNGWDVKGQSQNTYSTRYKLDNQKTCLKFLKSVFYIRKTARVKTFTWGKIENGYMLFEKDKMPICMVTRVLE